MGTKNFDSIFAGVPIADKTGLNGAQPSALVLWTLANLYRTPSFEPVGLSFSYKDLLIDSIFKSLLRTSLVFFSWLTIKFPYLYYMQLCYIYKYQIVNKHSCQLKQQNYPYPIFKWLIQDF